VHLKGGSVETVVEMVSRGQGYTLLPQLAADSLRQRKFAGTIVPIRKPSPARQVGLAHRRGHLKQSMLKLLRAAIEAALPADLPRAKARTLRVVELAGHFK
jgi:DNA-binding transcriptional LysR family regulator